MMKKRKKNITLQKRQETFCILTSAIQVATNCRFSYAGTELDNLFVGTKNFSYHTCYENIAKYSRVMHQQIDRPWKDN